MKDVVVILGADSQKVNHVIEALMQGKKIAYSGGENEAGDFCVRKFWGNPIDRLEALKGELREEGARLAKIVAVVDAEELERRKDLGAWFEALAHFADAMLVMGTREVSPAWWGALKKRMKDRPMEIYEWPECLGKRGEEVERITEAVLYPEARRLSQYFESMEEPAGEEIVMEDEDGNEVEEDGEETVAEKYFARDLAGRRVIKIIAP